MKAVSGNGFSRKLENHAAAPALNYFAYNFIKSHCTLREFPTPNEAKPFNSFAVTP
jgi:hypothetical protein